MKEESYHPIGVQGVFVSTLDALRQQDMNKLQSHTDKIGWQFDNTYSKLPDNMFSKLDPKPVKAPKIVIFNHSLSKEIGLDL